MSNGRPAERNGVRSRQRLWWLHAYSAKVAANQDANRPTSKAPFILLDSFRLRLQKSSGSALKISCAAESCRRLGGAAADGTP